MLEPVALGRSLEANNLNRMQQLSNPVSFIDNKQSAIATRRRARHWMLWSVLLLAPGVSRVIPAFVLPNEEGDPYSYVREIERMSAVMSNGTFSLSDLFGFWPPAYQFICALISVFVGHSLLVAKVFSALCGVGLCVVVFLVAENLTASRRLSLIAFAIIALSPLHAIYSSFSLTDVPNAFLVASSMLFVLKQRWLLAASCIALACLVRVESWLIIPLVPGLQYLLQRKFSKPALFIALVGPAFWLYVSWAATGNAFEYFEVRSTYVSEAVAAHVRLKSFSAFRLVVDLLALMFSTGPAVLIACLLAAWLVIKRASRLHGSKSSWPIAVALSYFFSSLGFLMLAYVTNNQPDIWPRYGLILFALGLPILAWTTAVVKDQNPAWAKPILVTFAVLCLCQWCLQVRYAWNFVGEVSQKRVVADFLRDKFRESDGTKISCDDSTIRVLSGIAASSFLDSSKLPLASELFVAALKENRVEYLVYERHPKARVEVFPGLADESIGDLFQLVWTTSPGAGDLELKVFFFTGGVSKPRS